MSCSIIIDKTSGEEIKSNLYKRLQEEYPTDEALLMLQQAMAYSTTNNGRFYAQDKNEADIIEKEMSYLFGENNVAVLKRPHYYDISIARPSFITDADLAEVSDMEAVRNSNFFSAFNSTFFSKEKKASETISQERVDSKLSVIRKKFRFGDDGKPVMTEEGETKSGKPNFVYTLVDGKLVKKRVSNLSKVEFEKYKTKEQLEAIEIASEPNRAIGSAAHEYLEKYMHYLAFLSEEANVVSTDGKVNERVEEPTSELPNEVMIEIANRAEKLFKYIIDTQRQIDPNKKVNIYLENLLFDEKRSIAGTVDLLVVYSDGSASIYDYKFMRMKTENTESGELIFTQEYIHWGKENAFNIQIGEYKRMLESIYGIKNIRETRIIPANLIIDNNIISDDYLDRLVSIQMDSDSADILKPLPVANEQSRDPILQSAIDTLRKRIVDLESQRKGMYNNPDMDDRRRSISTEVVKIKKAIQFLLVDRDITPFLEDIERIINSVNDNLEFMTIDSMVVKETILKSYFEILPKLYSYVDSEKLTNAMELNGKLGNVIEILENKIKDELLHSDIGKAQKPFGFITQYFTNLSMIDNPIFIKFKELVSKMFNKVQDEVRALAAEAEIQRNKLEEWAKSRGMSLQDAYRLFINPETGDLVHSLDKEFFKLKAEALRDNNYEFLYENYIYSVEGQKKYAKDLESYTSEVNYYQGEGSHMAKVLINNWIKNNDLSEADAWMNNSALFKYAKLRDTSKWLSKEYKDIQKDPVLLEFYDFLVSKNKEFNSRVDQRIDDTFVANISKGFISTLAQDSSILKAFKDSSKDFLNSMKVRQSDVIGTEDTKIPLLYYDKFEYKQKDGKYEAASVRKSEDLIQNLVLFGHQVFLNEQRNEIEDKVQGLRMLLKKQKVLKTNPFGSMIFSKDTGSIETTIGDEKALSAFDAYVDNYVYGKSIRSKDRTFTINAAGKDHTFSVNKIFMKMMSYMSIKSLAGNYISGVGNLGGAYANSFIKGTSGKYYTTEQLFAAHKMLIKRNSNDAWNRLTEYFNIEKDFWAKEQADKLSASWLTRNLTYDKWYILQQKGDEFVSNSVLMAMLQNYGVDSNGNVARLALLPKGTKSLMEGYSVVDDKIKIEGLTEEGYRDFRDRVKYISRSIKGTNTAEDISVIQTEVMGRAIMHFRNWIAPMIKERFGSLTYTPEIKEWEMGKYNAFVQDFTVKNFVPNVFKVLGELTYLRKVGLNDDLANEQYRKLEEKSKALGIDIPSLPEYKQLKHEQLVAAVSGLRMSIGLLLVMFSMGFKGDDDKEFYKGNALLRQIMRILHRIWNELSFFINPVSAQELLKSPIPVMRLLIDFINIISNTGDEIGDFFRNTVTESVDETDKTNFGYYTVRTFPVLRPFLDLWDDIVAGEE